MGIIHKLDNFTINQIAAGEVIERPASVVKELVENSIDADSTAITIEIEDGGVSYLRVTDNGIGMEKSDALISFERHATSKINEPTDLLNISSLGFRGEALASIASVSHFEMYTRTRNNLSGAHVINNGGEIVSCSEAGCPEGTTTIIRNLFYNTPARLKFLGSNRSESAKISELVSKLIMAHPEISFKYINQGKIIYHSPGDSNLLKAISTIYGRKIESEVIEIDNSTEDGLLSVKGYLGNRSLSRANRKHQSFFINGRYIKSQLISSCLEEAYKTLIMINHHPWAVLHINLPANEIDVNVHPTKTEIRFKNENHIYNLLLEWFKNVLLEKPKSIKDSETKIYNKPTEEKSEQIHLETKHSKTWNKDYSSSREVAACADILGEEEYSTENNYSVPVKTENDDLESANLTEMKIKDLKQDINKVQIIKESAKINSEPGTKKSNPNDFILDEEEGEIDELSIKIVGSVFATYVIVEINDKIYIIDQHAAHERLIFEKFKEMIDKQAVTVQQLLPPYVLDLTHDEFIKVEDNKEVFLKTGFELENFGGESFIIRGVPVIVNNLNIKEFFFDVLDKINQEKGYLVSDYIMEEIIMAACKSAVKANQILSESEIISLVKALTSNKIPLTCPHGRPILFTVTKYELEKKFKRIQG